MIIFLFSFFRTSLHSGVDNDDDDDNKDDDSSDSSLWPPLHPGLPLHQDSGLSTGDHVPSTPLPNVHGNMGRYDISF